MHLHILGPAFGLPSIDAECVATAALLQLHSVEGWKLLATHDLSLPVPRLTDGREAIEGFDSVASRVMSANKTVATSDVHQADAAAISSFVRTHGQPLLDISLYVSSDNYSTTRSAFTKILPWYTNYVLPPKRRADARDRTRHLGVSSIDVEDVHEDLSNRPDAFKVGKEPQFEAETQQRASLLLPRKNTVRSLLQRPEHSAVFKLHTLADNFFGPLQDMLRNNDYFLETRQPTAVDCVVYGYLSLMLYPSLPQDWLAKTMRRKYSKLVVFTQRMHEKLRMQTNVEDVMSLTRCHSEIERKSTLVRQSFTLPWEVPQATSLLSAAKMVALEVVTLVPIIHSFQVQTVQATPAPPTSWRKSYLPAGLAITAASLGMLAYYTFMNTSGEQIQVFGRKRFSDYGHLGAALAGMSLLSQQARDGATVHPQNVPGKLAQVDLEEEEDFAHELKTSYAVSEGSTGLQTTVMETT